MGEGGGRDTENHFYSREIKISLGSGSNTKEDQGEGFRPSFTCAARAKLISTLTGSDSNVALCGVVTS